MRTLICLAFLALASHNTFASNISFLKNSVYRVEDTNKVAAVLNDKITSNTKVGTGEQSMCELSLGDKSVTRIGANAVFTFIEQERLVKCDKGTFVVSKDPESQTMHVAAGSITAAVNGSTVLFDVKDNVTHVAVAETTTGVVIIDKNGKTMTLQSGEGVSADAGGITSAVPKSVDVKALVSASPLFSEPGALANDALIKGVADAQETAKAFGVTFASDINDAVSGKASGVDVPDVDTAAGAETAASSNSPPPSTPQSIPPVSMSPYPPTATPY